MLKRPERFDKEQATLLMSELANKGALTLIKEAIKDREEYLRNKLMTVSPTDVVKIVEYQTELRTYRCLKQFYYEHTEEGIYV